MSPLVQAALLGLAAAIGLALLTWLASLRQHDVSLVDRVWQATFSVEGALVTYFNTPPSELEPYSVPCGPRSTSIRDTSNVSKSPARIAPFARLPLWP